MADDASTGRWFPQTGKAMLPDPVGDVRRVAAEYGLDASREVASLGGFFESYLELALTEGGFEIITGGVGCAHALAEAARDHGLGAEAREAFLRTDLRFPGAMLGLKVAVGLSAKPTLYHRTMTPVEDALAHLRTLAPLAPFTVDLARAVGNAKTLYGLGFTEVRGAMRLKTYVLGNVDGSVGFRSVRVGPEGVEPDVREYVPDAPGDDATLAGIAGRALDVRVFGHAARSEGRAPKLYVERVGAIPTDFSAR